jgi:hypothetical protein
MEKAIQERARQSARSGAKRATAPTKVPPFDLQKFLDLERLRSMATLHAVLYAVLVSTVFILAGRAAGSAAAGAFAALGMLVTLRWYLKFIWGVEVTQLGKPTSLVGVFFAYFITCIMVSFLLSNPPFYDELAPEVHCCTYFERDINGSWVGAENSTVGAAAGSVRVVAQVFDNAGVDRVTLSYQRGPSWVNDSVMSSEGGGSFAYEISNLSVGDYTIVARAVDTSSHASEARSAESLHVV